MGRSSHKPTLAKTHSQMAAKQQAFVIPIGAQGPSSRIVHLTGNVDEETIAHVQAQIFELATSSKDPIHLVVSTYGGSVDEMFSLYDVMKFVPAPIYTVGLGKVMSAGSLILASGEKGHRLIGATTRVMIHSLSAGAFGNLFEMMNEVSELKRLQSLYVEKMAQETKMSKSQVEKMLSSKLDVIISAEEAISLGIVDKILK